jgi:outer membrane receptor protein involved in Fe transport
MYRVLQVLTLLLFCSPVVIAQNQLHQINGKAIDSQTKMALEGALVYTEKKSQGTISNADGQFSFKTEFTTIQIQFTGYAVKSIVLNQEQITKMAEGQFLNFELEADDELLKQVVVSAGKSRQKITETTVSLESIKPYLIENKNPPSIEQIIDQIPSANIVDGQVNIRGGSGWSYGAGSRVMVLVDGLPMLSGDAGSVQWSFIPMENIKNIEVIKGASSVLFGSAALNGIINIQTKAPSTKPETQVTFFSGVFDNPKRDGLRWQNNGLLTTSGIRAYHSFKKNHNEWAITANVLNDDGYRMGDFEHRARIGVNYKRVPNNKKYIYGFNTNFQKGLGANFLLWQSYDSAYTALNHAITTTASTRFNFDPSLVWYTNKVRHNIRMRYLFVDNQIDNGSPNNNQNNRSNFIYGEYQNEVKNLPWGVKLTSGLVYSKTFTSSPLFLGKQEASNAALFAQLEKKWKKLLLNAGGRLEHYALNNYNETKPVFRAGLNYELAKYTFLRSSFGQGYRFPTIGEAFISTNVGQLRIFPNPVLKSETGWNSEIGVKQGFKLGKVKGFADVAVFWTQYNDMMEFTFGQWSSDNTFQNGFGAGFKSINVGQSRIRGTELSMNGEGELGKGTLIFLAGYTYMDSKSLNPTTVLLYDSANNARTFRNTSSDTLGDVLKYRPKHLLKADVQYTIKKWDVGISSRYTSYMENIDKAFQDFPITLFLKDVDKGRAASVNGQWVWDYRMGYQVNKTTKFSIVVLNILNKEYMTRPADVAAPRSFSFQMVAKF